MASTLFTAAAQCKADLPEVKMSVMRLNSVHFMYRISFFPFINKVLYYDVCGVFILPWSSTALTSAWQCTSSSTIALHCQSWLPDEWRGAVIHTGIKIRGTVTDKNLEFKNTIMIGMC